MSSATSSGESPSDSDDHSEAELAPGETPNSQTNINEVISVVGAAQDGSSGSKTVSDPPSDSSNDTGEPGSKIMSSRAYQLEMLDQSLKQNVIVAMDTGSGKTQVAILRIKAELDRCAPEKIIWFLAPTVSLCIQQYEVIKLQAMSTPIKLLTGNDNVDNWLAKTWESVLKGIRIVISTPQILFDALSHAFVKMSDLTLLVFDEAHHCVKKSAGSKIMGFYHRQRQLSGDLPSVLGLTASPSMKADIKDLEALEANLDAKCVSPILHREELLKCVKRPQVLHIRYTKPEIRLTSSMRAIYSAYTALDINEDPYVLKLKADPTDRNQRALDKILNKPDTFCVSQVKCLYQRSFTMYQELGSWAADRYLWRTITKYLDRVTSSSSFYDKWMDEEKRYLAKILRRACPCRPAAEPQQASDVSEKARLLVRELASADDGVVGIIFVKERATVTMLHDVLTSCSLIRERFRIGTMVGGSNHLSKKKNVYEFEHDRDAAALQRFRSGNLNLLIATNVLEEGIDVPVCNLVVSFDQPATSKSFIQRRGRARMRDSRLILMEEDASQRKEWEAREEEMKQRYQDEEREFSRLELLESEEEVADKTYFEVESTGARLDFDGAKSHLEHFCRILSQGEFVDSRPDYIVQRHDDTSPPQLSAAVLLPSFVPLEQRRAESRSKWMSEKSATKDAAFQAYVALYKAGLINDDLLPLRFEKITGVESKLALVDVEPHFDPWRRVASMWREAKEFCLFQARCVDNHGSLLNEFAVLLPVPMHQPRPIRLYLDHGHHCDIHFEAPQVMTRDQAAQFPDHMPALLAMNFAHRWPLAAKSHIIKVAMNIKSLSTKQIASKPLCIEDVSVRQGHRLIRDGAGVPYTYCGILDSRPPIETVKHPFYDYEKAPSNVPYLVLKRWTKRSDFLHRVHPETGNEKVSNKLYDWVLPAAWATMDDMPASCAQLGMLLPAMIHELEVNLTAKVLADTLLGNVQINNMELVRTAISSRSASEPLDYERLEFLGDSMLKCCTSIQALADHLKWPEGYLSTYKDKLVSNARLSRAAVEKGLSKYILTRKFTGQKWRPLYVDNLLQKSLEPAPRHQMSTKTLADVVEAFIGASYLDGGMPKVLACMSVFLEEVHWQSLDHSQRTLFNDVKDDCELSSDLVPLEELIGYTFRKKSLLVEALTHASYAADASGSASLDRLEFLGDAVLDKVIVTRLYAVEPPLSHSQMHSFKTAMVNGDFLALATLEHGIHRHEAMPALDLTMETKDVFVPLSRFMRHASTALGLEQELISERYAALRDNIQHELQHGTHYPWGLLARLLAKKFHSDIFEALLGAIWVDSGSFEVCDAVVARFGIIAHMERMLRDGVEVMHPKELLGKAAVTRQVTYKIEVIEGVDGADNEYRCRVEVGGKTVAQVDDGVSKEEVKTRAAEKAIKVLAEEKG